MNYDIIANNPYTQFTEPFIKAQDVAPRTKEAYRANIERFFEYLTVKEIDPSNVNRATVIQYKNDLINDGKAPATINAYLTAVKRLFEWLESEGMGKNITKHIKGVKLSREHKKLPLLPIQWEALKESLSGTDTASRRDLMLIALGYGAGLRTIEMTRVRVEDIQYKYNHWVLMVEGKGSRAGEKKPVVIDNLIPVLKEYIKARGISDGLLFTSLSNATKEGNPLTTAGIRHIIKRRFKDVGIDNPMITSHSLRHGYAVAMLDAGASVENIQTAMRHDSIESTMIYLRARDMYKDPASNLIDLFGAA